MPTPSPFQFDFKGNKQCACCPPLYFGSASRFRHQSQSSFRHQSQPKTQRPGRPTVVPVFPAYNNSNSSTNNRDGNGNGSNNSSSDSHESQKTPRPKRVRSNAPALVLPYAAIPPAAASYPPPEWDLLLSYARKDLPEEIRRLVYGPVGCDPSHSNPVGQTALHVASLWGSLDAATELLHAGADPNARNRITGASPLHMAVKGFTGGGGPGGRRTDEARMIAVVDALIASGADRAQPDNYGATPLDQLEADMEESSMPSPSQQRLLEKLAPEKPRPFVAIDERNIERLQEALQTAHAPPADLRHRGHNLVSYVVREIASVAAAPDGDADADTGRSCDDLSVLAGMLTAILHVEGGIDAAHKHQDNQGGSYTPLYCALTLLRDAYKGSSSQPTAAATEWALEDIALDLAVADDDAVASDGDVQQLLHQAARRGELRFAEFLVEGVGVDPNARNRQGMTPLHFAARSGQMSVLEYLLRLGQGTAVRVDAEDDRGKTALDAARANDKVGAVRMLEEAQLCRI